MNHNAYGDGVEVFRIEEERSRALIQNISDMIFISDGLGRLSYGNPSFERVLSYNASNLEGGSFFELVHPDDWEIIEDALAGVAKARGASETFVCRVQDGRGTWHHLEINCSNLAHDPSVYGWIFIARDITEQVLMRKRLEGLNRCLLSLGPDHLQNIWTIIETGKEILEGEIVQYCRPDMGKLSTLSTLPGEEAFRVTEQPERHVCFTIVSGETIGPLAIEDLEETDYPQSYPLIKKHGLSSYLGYPVEVDGEIKGCLSIFDVKRRSFTQDEVLTLGALARALALEEERLAYEERLKDFIDIASHELRHPLTIIKGYTVSLQEYQEQLDKKKREYILGALDKGADRLEKLVFELLDVSRIEKGRFSVSKQRLPLIPLMEKAAEEMKDKGATNPIDIFISDAVDTVYADPDRLVDTLVVLLDNAVNYSPQGSKIIMQAEDRGSEIVLSILDRGYGIPEKDKLRVFERFYQVEEALPRQVPGIGLGLYIAREIVEAHGGWIWCEPREGGGSAFHFTIPRS
jgi:PAS domain S-box-containing protein